MYYRGPLPQHHVAHPCREVESGDRVFTVDRKRMGQGVGEGVVVLAEIVLHREFAAESIPAFCHAELVQIVVAGLNERRHVEPGQSQANIDDDGSYHKEGHGVAVDQPGPSGPKRP
jgi:hypothetical protein